MIDDNKLVKALRELALAIKKVIKSSISNGTIKPEVVRTFCRKVDKFEYDPKRGIGFCGWDGYFPTLSWSRGRSKLQESIKQTKEYLSVLRYLTKGFGKTSKVSERLDCFTSRVISQYLPDLEPGGPRFKAGEDQKIESLIRTFSKYLHEEPVKYEVEVKLKGITLEMDEIELPFGVTLRQPKAEDVEKEFYDFPTRNASPGFSAILKIEFFNKPTDDIHTIDTRAAQRVEQAVMILKLFRVGSIRWKSYRIYSDFMPGIGSSKTLISGRIGGVVQESYSLEESDIPRLKEFWDKMSNSISKSLSSYVTIAYDFYSSALLENSRWERVIAYSVMGLEALLLEESQELRYRLTLRLSKLLRLLGFCPYEVKNTMSAAYEVRNRVVHGKDVNEKKYGDIHTFLLRVLDYLRRLLVVMILLQNKKKEKFIDLVDDSLIDHEKESELASVISRAKEILQEDAQSVETSG